MKRIFAGQVVGGQIKLNNPKLFSDQVQRLEGKRVELTLMEQFIDRSSNQNRYYHGVVIKILGDELGYFHDEMHDSLKAKFLKIESGPIPRVISTTRLSTKEFETYLEKIRIWAASECNINIPLPGEIQND